MRGKAQPDMCARSATCLTVASRFLRKLAFALFFSKLFCGLPAFADEFGLLSAFRWVQELPADPRPNESCGFLFLNGKYVTSNEFRGLTHEPNGALAELEMEDYGTRLALKSWVKDELAQGNIVILYPRQSPTRLIGTGEGQRLLQILVNRNVSTSQDAGSRDGGPPETLQLASDRSSWERLVSEFKPTAVFAEHAAEHLGIIEKVQQSNRQIVSANLLVDRLAYPLTVGSMILVVIGFGHLLSNKPVLDPVIDSTRSEISTSSEISTRSEIDPKTGSVVTRTLLIFALLSGADLAWTISAAQSGSMRELNPLGSSMIQSPQQLIWFKVIATFVTVTLLYCLRERRIAQAVSWWSCLVLTLLTARWLTFNSMFL